MTAPQSIPCMYCCEPVGPDGDTDDGEFYVCGSCRAGAARRSREVMHRQAVAFWDDGGQLDSEPAFPFQLEVTRGDLDDYLTRPLGGRCMTPEALAERILDRIRREATGELEYGEPAIPLDAASLPADDCAKILAYLHRHAPRFRTYGSRVR